jgi:LacI family transcriptional regulator
MVKSSASLRDVARTAGVSLGTVSRALNNKANVLPETRSLVLKAASDLGYKLQIRVPTKVASKLNTIGVAIKRDPGEFPRIDPFNYAVLCGIEDECSKLGLNLMYASLPVDEYSHVTTWSPLLENGDVDGLIIVGVVVRDPAMIDCIPRDIPVVLVDAFASGVVCDAVLTHNVQGAYDVVKHLIDCKHTCIGLVGSSQHHLEHPSISDRRQGYLKALTDHGIATPYIAESQLHAESAYAATRQLLQQSPEVTAIFACNDEIGQHVIRAARDLGRDVPKHLSVVGFDDKTILEESARALTTVHVEKELMGCIAVRQLYERAINLERPPITTIIGTRVVVRDTVSHVE